MQFYVLSTAMCGEGITERETNKQPHNAKNLLNATVMDAGLIINARTIWSEHTAVIEAEFSL